MSPERFVKGESERTFLRSCPFPPTQCNHRAIFEVLSFEPHLLAGDVICLAF